MIRADTDYVDWITFTHLGKGIMRELLIIAVPCLAIFLLLHGEDPDAISYPSEEFQRRHQQTIAEIDEQRKRDFNELSSAVAAIIQQSPKR